MRPAPGIKVWCRLQTWCEEGMRGQYIITLTKTWDIKINGVRPVSYWKYRVIGEQLEMIEKQDNDAMVRKIK